MESKPKQSCERPVDVCAYYHTDPIPCAVNLLAPGARPLPLPPDTTHTQVNINKLLRHYKVTMCAILHLCTSSFPPAAAVSSFLHRCGIHSVLLNPR